MKIRIKSVTGFDTAEALGDSTVGEVTPATAVGGTVTDPTRSRRAPAATAHTNGPAAGAPPSPESNHDTTSAPTSDTAARGTAVPAPLRVDTAADGRGAPESAPRSADPRNPERAPGLTGPDRAAGAADTDESPPAESPSPAVSATATGTQANTDPTPSTAANTPTRPTARDADCVGTTPWSE